MGFSRMGSDKRKGQDPCLSMDFGLSWSLSDHQMVEAGGIEPPSANTPREASTGLGQD